MSNLKRQIDRAAFDNYDPDGFNNAEVISDLYDPDFMDKAADGTPATKVRTARPGVKLQLNISITNATASEIKTELFSALDSWMTRRKTELAVGNYTMIPLLTYEGLQSLITNPTGGNTVGFNDDGDCEVRGNVGDPKLLVGCGEYPYASLWESTKTQPFYNSYLRYTVSTDNQIDKNITHFTKTFGGGLKENRISPRAFFKPDQFQNKTIDIIAPFTIDGESGLNIPVLAGESLRLAFFIQRWGVNNV